MALFNFGKKKEIEKNSHVVAAGVIAKQKFCNRQ